jgi:dTDP-4-dehydrorhamnose reductase
VLHATSQGETSWHGLAQAVFEEIGADPQRVRPVSSAQFPRPAPRPAYSVLGHERWDDVGLPPLPPWREALRQGLPVVTGARPQPS